MAKAVECKYSSQRAWKPTTRSADHGAADPPGYLNELRSSANYINPKDLDMAPGMARIKKRSGFGKDLISSYFPPYIYLHTEAISKADLYKFEMERAVADEVMKLSGVALALSSAALASGEYPEMPIIRSVLNNFNPIRSGDIFGVTEPHSFTNDFDGLTVSAHHGSPWGYDTFVPLIFASKEIETRRVARGVETADLTPTVAAALGAKHPSGSAGQPSIEVIDALGR